MTEWVAGKAIWVIAKGYAPDEGGMQTYARGVAEAYLRAGAIVTVFTQTSIGPRDVELGGLRLLDVGPVNGARLFLRLVRAMRRALVHGPTPEFVHGTTWRTSVLPMLLGLPYVTTFHGREFMYGGVVPHATMRLVAQRARKIIAVSHYTAARLRERLGPRHADLLVSWNGATLDPGQSPGLAERDTDPPLLLSLCRLEPRKNIAACLEACARLAKRGSDFRYVIAGRGPELPMLRALNARLGLENSVEIAGFVPDAEAAELYRRAAIFLHPQVARDADRDFEGFGIVIADAMAAGAVPIVGEAGGAAELVEDGVSGLVVDGLDRAALASALAGLLDNPGARRTMAAAANARAGAYFTWDRHIDPILSYLGGMRSP